MMQPEQYDLLYECEQEMWWFVGMRAIVSSLLSGLSRPGLCCLEAGCGTGYNSVFFKEHYGWQVFPVDLSERALCYARQRGVERLSQADITRLPYADNAFDCVTSLDVVYSVPDRASALREFWRVTKPGGFVLVRVAALRWMGGGHGRAVAELHRSSAGELAGELRAAGFRARRATYANMFLLPLAALKRKVLEPLGIARDGGDVRMPSLLVNRVGLAALALEDSLLKHVSRLPIGLSAIVLAEK